MSQKMVRELYSVIMDNLLKPSRVHYIVSLGKTQGTLKVPHLSFISLNRPRSYFRDFQLRRMRGNIIRKEINVICIW